MNQDKIPTIDEMRENALKIADSTPNLRQNHEAMTQIRGQIIELFLIIEICFNQLITSTGKEMVLDSKNKELHLIKGMLSKNDLPPRISTKSRDMKKLIKLAIPQLSEEDLELIYDKFTRLIKIRDIFAHVPI